MKYDLWKITKNHGRGDPSDGSESWNTVVSYTVVSQEDEESFGDIMASDYGDTDYSYTVDYTKIATFNGLNEVKVVADALKEVCK